MLRSRFCEEMNVPEAERLEQVLAYRHEDLVHRFAEEQQISLVDAEELFLETKRWLWFSAKQRREGEPGNFPLFNEAYAIDLMWHTFLLYTEDYTDFCERHFGFFLHHRPRSRADRLAWQEEIRRDPEGARQKHEQLLRQAYEKIYDELGAETLSKWCEDFPRRFPFGKRDPAERLSQ